VPYTGPRQIDVGGEQQLAGKPQDIQNEIIRTNTEARPRALQIALLVPLIASLLGLVNAFRMMRLPEVKPSGAAGQVLAG